MSRFFTFWIPMAAGFMAAGGVLASDQYLRMPADHSLAATHSASTRSNLTAYFDEEAAEEEADDAADDAGKCGCADSSCGSDASCGCHASCDCGWGSCLGDCCLGEAWTLQDYLHPCCDKSITYGGWISAGYYNHNERLSREVGDGLSFNDVPNEFGFDQVWFYTEKLAVADACSADWGYRFDIFYGRQGHTAQAFGNEDNVWDVSLDHGYYEWAMPQLYLELAYGDWSWKLGHFFTVAGYEVVQATGNFFYSHALTHYNSEPFTHTGALGTYNGLDNATIYAGYTFGWDTGFDQFKGGSSFLGGFTVNPNDNVALTYVTTVGNLGWKSDGEFGYSQHIVGTFDLSDNLQYVLASDYLYTEGIPGDPDTNGEDKSVVNYLFYTLNDCWKLGGRVEWWKSDNVIPGDDASFYEISGGLNYHAMANLVFRPEIRYDWTPSNDAYDDEFGIDYNQTWFGIDAVLAY